jgi:hypothetical protein
MFVANFVILLQVGGLHPEEPYILVSQFSTSFYFAWFLLVLPLVNFIERSLCSIDTKTGRGARGLSEIQPNPVSANLVRSNFENKLNRRYYSTSTINKSLANAKKELLKAKNKYNSNSHQGSYENPDIQKVKIYFENKGKAGIYL